MTKRGKLVLFALLFILSLLIGQEINNQNLNRNRDFQLLNERQERDIFIKKGIDSSTSKIFNNLSKAFAEQGLKIDSVNNSIIKLRDSIKSTIRVDKQPFSVFKIDTSGISIKKDTNNKDYINISFTSRDAPSYDLNVTCYLLTVFNNKAHELYKLNPLPKHQIYPTNAIWDFRWMTNIEDISKIYLRAIGTYKSVGKKKLFHIDDIIIYDNKTKENNVLVSSGREDFINFLKQYPKNKIINID
ncbi:hypothetical protein [Hyunsoonleella pacifica]|uniref:Uncharacterized protein n=1 Tax=Hyunsoonleella pacifica TaxID=1080224 RepID=A0A4V2JAV9_9FLAO|nr:hypothetical protein [Hyunsoonleella pacifica]TBN15435.1 hypothetical protein EYD46_09865 [Hyunsoonleella pacifica]